ncbi:ribonucleases P/MRP protein subunit POP1 [Anopheles marshallii]|uniref:ribonucleases P/MRP protein subunit POP1 n=1 Tax=Anopheles marshallii TaxID=1521116 RepID=UPI00237C3921|nr:ribonucleases P/MRP protein subunit POP1 [Anopheles marshallii]
MASTNMQFDAAIGGSVTLPKSVDLVSFAESRKEEVCQMLRNMTSTMHQRKLMHQSLPIHMRRRAMSYDVKRLPRKFRTVHLAQFSKSGVSEKKKRPSRKFRRKAHNLLKEYERRKRAFVWLETHVWHAKRFRMSSRWGYKIPLTPYNKVYRSSYRATSKHCLVHDLSYEGCIEISGAETILKEGLRRLCSEQTGLTVAAKAYTAGQRAGYVWLYEDGAYPYNCLGRVRFVWRTTGICNNTERRTIWIFAHPTFYRPLVEQLVQVFQLKNALRETNQTIADITRNPAEIRCPRYTSKSGVEVVELKDTLNRFHLTGPLSHATIVKTFRLFTPPTQTKQTHRTWWNDFIDSTPKYNKILSQQTSYWADIKDLTTPGELSPGEVIALLVQDPRLNRPTRRTKALPNVPTRYNFTQGIPPELVQPRAIRSFSPLWDETIRQRIGAEMKSTHELNQLRSVETLLPGEPCVSETHLQPLPILLLQSPGSQDADYKRLGYGSGWEVIVPAGYGLAVWHSLVMWGAKPVGQKELDMVALESGHDRSGVPDTVFGKDEAVHKHSESLSRYFKRPNNKRVNYTKLAIASPFRCPWTQLVQEWNGAQGGSDRPYFVLRDQEALAKLKLALDRKFNVHSIGLSPDALVPVLLTLKTRGNPGDNAIICLPNRGDFRTNKTNRLSAIHGPVYVEPARKDPHGAERIVLRAQHLKTLKRLRNRRVREKIRLQRANPGVLVRIPQANNRALVEEQLKRMAELWLPAKPATIRNQCSRECFGYVTQGGFSLSEGTVNGIGYVTAKGLVKLFKICTKGTVKVLVRGTRTRGYRFATIRLAY